MLAVRYEDLLADTAGQLGRIVRFLQLAGVAEGALTESIANNIASTH